MKEQFTNIEIRKCQSRSVCNRLFDGPISSGAEKNSADSLFFLRVTVVVVFSSLFSFPLV